MGNLPSSRTITLAPGDPIPAALLNELQDRDIASNSALVATQELVFHISSFQVDGASTYVTFNQIGYISGFGGACTVQAPVRIEVGKKIVSYQQFYDVNGTGAGILPRLRRMNLATGAINNVAAGTSDNTGTGVENQLVSASDHVVLSGEAYFIEVSVTNAGHRVHGAIVKWKI